MPTNTVPINTVPTDALPATTAVTSAAATDRPLTSLRLGVAQTTHRQDPGDVDAFRAAGAEIRTLLHAAAAEGADLVVFPEATLCFPAKLALSSRPGELAVADWSRFAWSALESELTAVAATARELGIWAVVGAQHRQAAPAWPRTSLLVIDADGRTSCRYDERLLSRTKQTYLYEAGEDPVTFEVGGVRIGCTSGLEVLFPDLYSDYEADGVDCVVFATAGPPDPAEADSLASSARTAALQNGLWVAYATPSDKAPFTPSGVVRPDGTWAVQCPDRVEPAVVVTEVGSRLEGAPRDWRRRMLQAHRAGAPPEPVGRR